MQRAHFRTLSEVVVWAALSFGVWMLTLSSVTTGDIELAIPSAVLAGLMATAGRRFVGGVALGLPEGFGGWLWRLPVAVLTDTVAVLILAARSFHDRDRPGELRVVQLPHDESDREAEERRSVGALMLAATPGSFTADNDPDRRRMTVHQLLRTRPAWAAIDPAARR